MLKKSIRRITVSSNEALIVEDANGNEYLRVITDANGGVLFGGALGNTWSRQGTVISSAFFAEKADIANRNSGVQVLFSDQDTRATDFSLMRAGGTKNAPTSVTGSTVISNLRYEVHDGVNFRVPLTLRVLVDGTPATGDLRAQYRILTWNGINEASAFCVRANRCIGLGDGLISPSAWAHLAGGTTTRAPFKYTSGSLLTTPENGAKEYDGTNEFLTSGGVRYTIAKTLTATATLDFGSIASGATETLTITVAGAVSGDAVSLGVPNASMHADIDFFAWVSANNTVSVRCRNFGGGAVDPASGTFRAVVIKY